MSELIIKNDSNVLRIELDIQISTAKAYPRSVHKSIQEAVDQATSDEETAESCFYILKRKNSNEDGSKPIEGPSIRLAEIFASCWGNIHVASRVTENNGKIVKAEAIAWDLEKNVQMRGEAIRRITYSSGKTYTEDMQIVTANAAQAIAVRNALFKVIPKSYVNRVLVAAKKAAVGDQKSLKDRAQRLLDRFEKIGIDKQKIFSFLGKNKREEFTPEDIETLIGIGTSIREGILSIDNAFSMEEEKLKKPVELTEELLGE